MNFLLLMLYFWVGFAVGAFLGSFGFAAIIYSLTITREFFVKAKAEKLVKRIPLSPIYLPPLIWATILSVVTFVILHFVPKIMLGYVVGLLFGLYGILKNKNNPANREEVVANNEHYLKAD